MARAARNVTVTYDEDDPLTHLTVEALEDGVTWRPYLSEPITLTMTLKLVEPPGLDLYDFFAEAAGYDLAAINRYRRQLAQRRAILPTLAMLLPLIAWVAWNLTI